MKSVKFLLSAATTILVVTGFILLTLGVTVLTIFNNYHFFVTDIFFTLTNLVIATAVIIFFTSTLGFYGAITEKFKVIVGFLVLVVIIIILEIAITILAFSLEDGNGYYDLMDTMLRTLKQFGNNWEVAAAWDDLHREYGCCGMYKFEWTNSQYPVSCCDIPIGAMSPFECTSDNANTGSCDEYFIGWIYFIAVLIGYMVASVICIQGIIAAIAAWQAYRVKYQKVALDKPFKYDLPSTMPHKILSK